MKGAVSGALWGLVLGCTGLSFASLVNDDMIPANLPQTPQMTTPQMAETDLEPADLVETAQDPSPTVLAQAPQVETPEVEAGQTVIEVDPPKEQQAADVDPALAEPAGIEQPPAETALREADQVLETASVAPSAPVEPSFSNDAASGVVTADNLAEPPAEVQAPSAIVAEPVPIEPPVPDIVAETAQESQAVVDEAAPEPDENIAEPEQAPVVSQEPEPAPDTAQPATVEPTQPASVIVTETPAPADDQAPTPNVDEPAPPVIEAPTSEQPSQVAVAEPSVPDDSASQPLPRVSGGVRVNRPGAEPSATAGVPAEIAQPEEPDQDAPALVRFAAPFENPEGRPLVSLVLVDDGTMMNAANTLAELSFPVTIILDPLQPDVAETMASYRAVGVEIGLQVALPLGARAQDVEVAFEAAFGMIPEAVVLYSSGDDLLQSDRAVTEQVVQVLAAEGLGLVAIERGLSNVQRIATQAGVPAATIQRSLEGDSSGAIGRALDQAAFRARQGTGAVLLGRLTPEMLEIFGDWAADADNNQVAVAPISAVLTQ